MIVYWYLAPNPPGEEKLSDVSTQQLHIKNSSLVNTRSFVTWMLVTGPVCWRLWCVFFLEWKEPALWPQVQFRALNWDHSTFVCVCVCVRAYICMHISTYSNTGKLWLRKVFSRGAWVAQSMECPALDFGSGHDLRVMESPCQALHWVWSLLKIPSLPLFLCPSLSLSLK